MQYCSTLKFDVNIVNINTGIIPIKTQQIGLREGNSSTKRCWNAPQAHGFQDFGVLSRDFVVSLGGLKDVFAWLLTGKHGKVWTFILVAKVSCIVSPWSPHFMIFFHQISHYKP